MIRPELIRAIYERPRNLALGKPARQSSCYGGLDAHLGVDGNNDGSNPQYCMSTQQDPQAWWEVDLGEFRARRACVYTCAPGCSTNLVGD